MFLNMTQVAKEVVVVEILLGNVIFVGKRRGAFTQELEPIF